MIFVSSGGESAMSGYEFSTSMAEHGIRNIELSSGKHDGDILKKLKRLKAMNIEFNIHNYFPPPENPFVLNLATLDAKHNRECMIFAESAIKLAAELNTNRYSFHAGFLIDPKVTELGKKINNRKLYSREECISVFIENVKILSKEAEKIGVQLFIENNVLTKNTLRIFGENPFLMVTADECMHVMNELPNVSLLVDVAHLKVSANTLNFDKNEFLKQCESRIGAYHISENDGTQDSNEKFDKNSWFWPYIKKDAKFYTIEVYRESYETLSELYELTEWMIKNDYSN